MFSGARIYFQKVKRKVLSALDADCADMFFFRLIVRAELRSIEFRCADISLVAETNRLLTNGLNFE